MTTFTYDAYTEDGEEDIKKTLDYDDIDGLITDLEEDENSAESIPSMINDVEVYNAYSDAYYGYPEDITELEDLIDKADEAYQGEFASWTGFAMHMADALDVFTNVSANGWPFDNIDWKGAGDDLKQDYSAYDGHYFRDM